MTPWSLDKLPSDITPTNIDGAYARTGNGRIVPHLVVDSSRTRDLRAMRRSPRRSLIPFRFSAGGYINNLWSGVYLTGNWDHITAHWSIPAVSKPPEPPGLDGLYWMYSWIGLDGAGTPELLQIGIDQRVHPDGSVECNPWFEWVAKADPNNPPYVSYTWIDNVNVRPGDEVSCDVTYWVVAGIRAAGLVEMWNKTTNQSFGLFLKPPPLAPMAGATAEWIVECPGKGYPDFALAQFSEVKFSKAKARGPLNVIGVPSNANPNVNMENIRNAANVVVTTVEIPEPGKVPEDWLRIRHNNDGLCQRLKNLCQTIRALLFRTG